MAFEVKMTGSADLYSVRRALKQVGATGLGKDMDKAFRKATKPLEPAIKSEALSAMPSGYGPVLSRSLAFRLASRTARQSTQLRFRVYADGQQERRDIPTINKGRLRHPVYGRRRQPWVTQQVRPGFVDRPVNRLVPQIRKEMLAVLDSVTAQLKG